MKELFDLLDEYIDAKLAYAADPCSETGFRVIQLKHDLSVIIMNLDTKLRL